MGTKYFSENQVKQVARILMRDNLELWVKAEWTQREFACAMRILRSIASGASVPFQGGLIARSVREVKKALKQYVRDLVRYINSPLEYI